MFVSGNSILNKRGESTHVTDYTLKNIAFAFKREPEFYRVTMLIDLI